MPIIGGTKWKANPKRTNPPISASSPLPELIKSLTLNGNETLLKSIIFNHHPHFYLHVKVQKKNKDIPK